MSNDVFSKKALLVYQANQHCLWHHTIGTQFGFSLVEIEEELLKQIRDNLPQAAFNTEPRKMQLVSPYFPPSTPLPAHLKPHISIDALVTLLCMPQLDSLPPAALLHTSTLCHPNALSASPLYTHY